MRISDWSSDVCSSDLHRRRLRALQVHGHGQARDPDVGAAFEPFVVADAGEALAAPGVAPGVLQPEAVAVVGDDGECVVAHRRLLFPGDAAAGRRVRSEEHTSDIQSLMRISYAVFCLKKKK